MTDYRSGIGEGRTLVQHCLRMDGVGYPFRYMYGLIPAVRLAPTGTPGMGLYLDKRGRTWVECGMTGLTLLLVLSGPSVKCGEFEMFRWGLTGEGVLIDNLTGEPVAKK